MVGIWKTITPIDVQTVDYAHEVSDENRNFTGTRLEYMHVTYTLKNNLAVCLS